MLFYKNAHSIAKTQLFHLSFSRNYSSSIQSPIRIAFCGSDLFSIYSLRSLLDYAAQNPSHIQSIDLLTRKPKPAGRGRKTIHSVPILSELHNINSSNSSPILSFTPESTSDFLHLQNTRQYDLVIAVSYGKLIPHQFLSLLTYGGLNVHPSLLPKYSGASPLHSALLNRDPYTGVTVQTLHPTTFDKGDILFQTGPIQLKSLLNPLPNTWTHNQISNDSTFGLPSIPIPTSSPSLESTESIISSTDPPLLSLTNSLGLIGASSLISVLSSMKYQSPSTHKVISQYPYSYSPRIPSTRTEILLSKMDISSILVNNKVLGPLYLWQQVHEKKKKQAAPSVPTSKRVQLNSLTDVTASFSAQFPKVAEEMELGHWHLLNVDSPKLQNQSSLVFKVKNENEGYAFVAAKEYKLQGFQQCSAFQLSKSMKKWGIIDHQFLVK